MRPSNKNIVMNGIVNGYVNQKRYDGTNGTSFATTWKAFNGSNVLLDTLTLDETAFSILSELKCYFGAFNCEFKDGKNGACLVWLEDGYIYASEMSDDGALRTHKLEDDGKEEIITNDDTASNVLAELLAIENGGGSSSIDPTQKQTFSGGVEITTNPLDVESEATFGSNVEIDGKLTLNTLGDIVAKDGGVLPSIAIVRH